MASAARHLKFTGGLPGQADTLVASLEHRSIQLLRHQLHEVDFTEHAAALATTRTLCQADIMSGGTAWRAHLAGARAILHAAGPIYPSSGGGSRDPVALFLSSWYHNADALTALTPLGMTRGQLEADSRESEPVYFDVFGGVASDLPDLFREVGALVMERRRKDAPGESEHCSLLSEDDILQEADELVQEIHSRLSRDAVGNLRLSESLRFSLSRDNIHDYALSNIGFLHTALLHVHCRIRMLSSTAPEVQRSVQQIIWCAENMKSSSALSPTVLLITPLFNAGLWAVSSARPAIQEAFRRIMTWMRTVHVQKAVTLLEDISSTILDDPEQDVWSYLEHNSPEFLPY
ncbi:c6 zinc finger domain-containing protein [Thozetella sp. PMI_491]|nr:c6 zinc finger domain-containing protein [Thozetella sp. PMI_491]